MMRHYSLAVNFCSNTTQHWLIIFTPTGHTHCIPDAGLSSVTIHQSNLCMKTLETSAWIKTLEENTHDCTKPAELPPPPPPLGYTTTSFDKTSDLCPRFSLCLKDGGRLGRVTMYTHREREREQVIAPYSVQIMDVTQTWVYHHYEHRPRYREERSGSIA